jgi:hypothetical protein
MNNIGSPFPSTSQKPGKVQAVAIMTLISGIANILWMIIIGISILIGGIASLGVGCLFVPIVIPPIVLGVFEILYAVKLLPTPIKPAKPSQVIAILEIVCVLTLNFFAVATGIVALVMYSDPVVKAYFEANAVQKVNN